jgi:hypothetical protein
MDSTRAVRRLIWLYFWLLIFEGALRKWVLPGVADALLIVRDPVVIAIYLAALNRKLFPVNGFVQVIFILAAVSFVTGLFAGHGNGWVMLFGVRTNFLHLPLIYLIPKVFDLKEVEKIGRWALILALPMAVLMFLQFRAPAGGVLNRGMTEEFSQLPSMMGRVRASGTFSFVTGPVAYFSLVAAFFIHGFLQKKIYPLWVVWAAAAGLAVSCATSGSRAFVLAVALVFMMLVVIWFFQPRLTPAISKLLFLGAIGFLLIWFLPMFKEGLDITVLRFEQAHEFEAETGGIGARFLRSFTSAFGMFNQVPFFGHGIGMGTNVGAVLLTGQRQFLLAEFEWDRILMESGVLLGPLYILLRIAIVFSMARRVLGALRRQNALPILIFAACALSVVNGAFGQSTALGFAVLGAGLCLAAGNFGPPAKGSEGGLR